MSRPKLLPCPQKDDCPIPRSSACTAAQFATCEMVNSVEYIAALLGRPHYLRMPTFEKALFLSEHFSIFIDPDEASSEIPRLQLVAIIQARIAAKVHT